MHEIIGNFGRSTRTTRWTVALAAGALTAAMAAATPAAAWDPQATGTQIDNYLSHHAAAPDVRAQVYPSAAYAAAPAPRRHRSGSSGAYASAHTNQQPTTPTPPHKDFQDYK